MIIFPLLLRSSALSFSIFAECDLPSVTIGWSRIGDRIQVICGNIWTHIHASYPGKCPFTDTPHRYHSLLFPLVQLVYAYPFYSIHAYSSINKSALYCYSKLSTTECHQLELIQMSIIDVPHTVRMSPLRLLLHLCLIRMETAYTKLKKSLCFYRTAYMTDRNFVNIASWTPYHTSK